MTTNIHQKIKNLTSYVNEILVDKIQTYHINNKITNIQKEKNQVYIVGDFNKNINELSDILLKNLYRISLSQKNKVISDVNNLIAEIKVNKYINNNKGIFYPQQLPSDSRGCLGEQVTIENLW